jgi:hypothetical protein
MSELVLDAQGSESAEEIRSQGRRIAESLAKINKHYGDWIDRGIPEIGMYANACKAEEKPFDDDQICEAIAVLDRGNELATGGQRLRAPQILALLVFLGPGVAYRGKLCQIESGEGTRSFALYT